jgi:hypothetical protein
VGDAARDFLEVIELVEITAYLADFYKLNHPVLASEIE